MKRIFKLLLVVCIFALTTCFLASCGEPKDLLATYLFEKDEQVVTSDFVLDSQLTVGEKSYALTWTSDNEAVKISSEAVDGKYTCVVTRPLNEEVTVKLTVNVNKESKDFTVRITPVDVYDFTKNYVFPQNKQKVVADFDLDQSFTFDGKECPITWSSRDELVTISEDGKKAIITTSPIDKDVKIIGRFEYNGEVSEKVYSVIVSSPVTPYEKIITWYTETGISQELRGYVVEVATVYSDTYGNISLYVVDESLQAGYYFYRAKCTKEEAEQVVPGAYVVLTGSTNTMYNGLMETNQDGKLEVDETHEKLDLTTAVFNLDNDLLAGSQSTLFHSSRLVSLSGWKVVTDVTAPKNGETTTLFEVERDGVKIKVATSKYAEGFYSTLADKNDPKFQAIVDKVATIKKGDFLDLNGLLGNYNGYQIIVTSADSLNVSSEKEESLGSKLGKVIAEVKKTVPAKIKEANFSLDLITSKDGATISWALSNDVSKTTKVENNKLISNPTEKADKVNLIATYKLGEFETSEYYSIVIELGEEVDPATISILDAKAKAKGEEALVQGTVMAVSEKGYILYDGTDAVYVYVAGAVSEEEKTVKFKVGDVVKVNGKLDYYNVIELVPTESSLVNDGEKNTAPTAKALTGAEMDTYINGTTFAQELVEVEGVLSISNNKYYNLTVEGAVVAQGSLSNIGQELKDLLATNDGKSIKVKGWTIGISKSDDNPKFLNILVESVECETTIAQVKAFNDGKAATVKGVIVAVSTRGYVLTDGEASIYVYFKDGTDSESSKYVIGDKVEVKGEKTSYNDLVELIPASSKKIEGEFVTPNEATLVDGAAIDAYVKGPGFDQTFVKFLGRLSISGNFYNVEVDGTTVQGSLSYLTDDQKAGLTSGEIYTFEGWTIGQSGNGKFYNIILTNFSK